MKKEYIFLFLFLLGGFLLRLYRLNNPIADWHSWRQADTSAVSRNFVNNGFDVLHPTYDDISNIQTGFDNPKGYRFVEFPIYNVVQAGLYKLFGLLTLEEWGRLVTIFASLGGSFFLYLLVKKRNNLTAWFVFMFSVFLPYNIYYGRTILPDTSMVATLLGGIYFFERWLNSLHTKESEKKYWVSYCYFFLSIIFSATSLLLKPYAIFYFLPFVVLLWNMWQWKIFSKPQVYLYIILVLAPILGWRWWEAKFPEGIPAYTWLFNGNGIRFRPSFFRWIFYERITKLIGGFFNAIFIVTGTIQIWKEKDKLFLMSFPISALLYLFVIATGNVQHDYYQIVIMPAVSLVMGYGVVWGINFLNKFINNKKFVYGIITIFVLLGFWFSWQQVKDYFNINNWSIVRAGIAVDTLTPKNAKIIAPYNGDTSFLYETKRKGWPAFEKSLPDLVKMGADYLVLVNPKSADFGIGKDYKIISYTSDYILFDVHKKP